MIQYTMLEGPTSTLDCAHQLGKLCEGKNIIVNLIPYNQTDVKDCYKCPSLEHIDEFQKIVMGYGLFVFIRKTMGEDIAGACGQLVLEKSGGKKNGEEKKEGGDIEVWGGGGEGGGRGGGVGKGKGEIEVKKRVAKRDAAAVLAGGTDGVLKEGKEVEANEKAKGAESDNDLVRFGFMVSAGLGICMIALAAARALRSRSKSP